MTTAYTSLLGLALPVTGELSGTWGDTVNNSITSLLDSAVAGATTITTDANITLSTTTGAANESRQAIIIWTASGTVTRTITAPAQSKVYTVINKSSTQSIKIVGVGPTTGVTIRSGVAVTVAWDGTDFRELSIQTLYPTVTISGNMDNGATDYSLTNTPTVTSAVTTQASIYRSFPSTAATSFTLTNLIGYRADQGTIGATSAVTNQYGFYANSTLTGAANNIGMYSGIAASAAATITGINGNGSVVTVTTSAAHGLVTGDSVIIANVPTALMLASTTYNGGPRTVTLINSTSFTYASTATSSAPVTSGNTVKANNWNFYGGGTGNNWFGGPTMISASSELPALRVTQTGTGYTVLIEDSSNTDVTPFAITAAGLVGIGTALPTNALSVTGNANITGNTTLGDATTDTVTVNGYMGVGGAGATTTGLKVVSAALTGAAQDGIQSAPVATSAATSQIRAFTAIPSTAAAAFTCTSAYGFRAFDASTGAGSTITNLYGVYVNDLTQGLTNNYGITSVVTSGTNKFNLYISGTADNYFAGDVGIGTTTPVGKVDVFGDSGGGAGTVVPVSITVGDTSAGNLWPGDGTLSTVFNYYSGDGTNQGVRFRHGVGETNVSGSTSVWKIQYRAAGGAINNYTGFSDALQVDTSGNVQMAGQLLLGDGSAAAPALSNFGDDNTGIFFPAADTISFAEGGVEVVRIDVGSNLQMLNGAVVPYAPTPSNSNSAETLTNAKLQSQIINTTGTTFTVTMPLGTTLETLVPWATTNIAYDFYVINTASGTITMAANTGVTTLGGLTIATGVSAHFRIRRTAANTFVLYRLS